MMRCRSPSTGLRTPVTGFPHEVCCLFAYQGMCDVSLWLCQQKQLLLLVTCSLVSLSSESYTIRDPRMQYVIALLQMSCAKASFQKRNCRSNTYDLLSDTKCGSVRQLLSMVQCPQGLHGDKVLNRPIVPVMWNVILMDGPQ